MADLRITMDANTAQLEQALIRARAHMARFEGQLRSVGRAGRKIDDLVNERHAQALQSFGRGMLVFGAAVTAGLGLAVKAAIDWESAWAGVLKTVEGSPQQLAELENGLRALARELPVTHEEVAALAESAGQLGVATQDILQFTRVMIDLGQTTNLTSEEAANAIARLMNIMSTAPGDVDNLASALVDLGNKSASTESEILEMALRIAGAGATIGLTESDVLAFATALSDVGVRAQAGGSSISRVMMEISNAVMGGGEQLRRFASTAGVSAQEFARVFREEPAKAIEMFVTGLGRIDQAGGNVFAVLDGVNLNTIRTRDSVLRLANSEGLLNEHLRRGIAAWKDNSALVEEARRRYDTTESQIRSALSSLSDLAITIGGVVLPAVDDLATGASNIFDAINNLPGPLQTAVTLLGGLAGVVAVAGGAFLLAAPKIAAARLQLQLLAATHPGASRVIRLLGRVGGIVGGVVLLGTAIAALVNATKKAPPAVSDMTSALLDLHDGIEHRLLGSLKQAFDLLQREPLSEKGSRPRWLPESTEVHEAAMEFERLAGSVDKAIASMIEGGQMDLAKKTIKELGVLLGLGGKELQRWVKEHLPKTTEAMKVFNNTQRATQQALTKTDRRLMEIANRFSLTGNDAVKAAQDMIQAWVEAGTRFVDILGAYETALARKEEKERQTAVKSAQATENVNDTWEDFVGEVKLTVDEYLAQLRRMVENQTQWRNNLIRLSGRVSDEMLSDLAQLGPEGADLVALFASMTDQELREAEGLWEQSTDAAVQGGIVDPVIDAGPVLRRIAARHGRDTANQIRDFMIKHSVGVEQAARQLGIDIDDALREGEDRRIPVRVIGHGEALRRIKGIGQAIKGLPNRKEVEVTFAAFGRGEFRSFGRARGGEIRGPGGPTEDRAGLFALSNREWVIRADAAARQGGQKMQALNEGRADIVMSGKGGRWGGVVPGGDVSRVRVDVNSEAMRARAFRELSRSVMSDFQSTARSAFRGEVLGSIAARSPGPIVNTGKVLPPGRYRIGRGPASHGYNARDLPAPIGTPVYSAAAGRVFRAGWGGGYGRHVRIDHGSWRSLYAHMSRIFVRTGQRVLQGQQIGRVGSTGNSTGPHLHLEPDLARLYDRGGKWPHGALGMNTSGGTEYVLSPHQSRMFDRMIVAMEKGRFPSPSQQQSREVNVNVQAWTERFSWRQVQDELAFHGVT